jgi:hypothetical protein
LGGRVEITFRAGKLPGSHLLVTLKTNDLAAVAYQFFFKRVQRFAAALAITQSVLTEKFL